MTSIEKRAALGLALIFALRMLGLFMILPVFSLLAGDLQDATPQRIGLAIGAYGFTQAFLQIPFGLLSDRIGRKTVIAAGLLLFAAGSVVAAEARDIWQVIFGRALQGSGAVAAAIMALAADLTREEHRTKAMALIGMSIGMAFAASMVLGPLVGHWLGLSGLFWTTAALALLGLIVLFTLVPNPAVTRFHRDAEAQPSRLTDVLASPDLLRLDFGILSLHAILTATFVALPLALRQYTDIPTFQHSYVYLPVMVVSILFMVPLIILAERKGRLKPVFLIAIGLLALAETGLLRYHVHLVGIVLALVVFFTGFNLLEALLPSLVSKTAPADLKGTAMGVYSSSQFFGAFIGGAAGGWLLTHHGLAGVFAFCAALAGLWGVIALGMKPPRPATSLLIHVDLADHRQARLLARKLRRLPGVIEVVVVPEDRVAYLKVDKRRLNPGQLETLVSRFTHSSEPQPVES